MDKHTDERTSETTTTTTTTSVAIVAQVFESVGFICLTKVALVLYCLEQAHSFTRVVLGLWSTGDNNGDRFEKADVFVSE